MTALKTRTPTGRVPWPLVLVEGPEKSGKSFGIAVLSASEKVGQTYWLDLGEGSADEYGAVEGARYLVVKHDGKWATIYGAVEAVYAEAQRANEAGEPPVVLAIDSMTAGQRRTSGNSPRTHRPRSPCRRTTGTTRTRGTRS
jgi:hypothetical protein